MRFLLGTVNKPRLTSLAALATLAVLSVLVVYQQCSCESLCLWQICQTVNFCVVKAS